VKEKSSAPNTRIRGIRKKIIATFEELLINEGIVPSVAEIAERSKYPVEKIPEVLSEEYLAKTAQCAVLTDKVVASIYEQAIKGNVPSQRLWLQYVQHWAPPKSIQAIAANPEIHITFKGKDDHE